MIKKKGSMRKAIFYSVVLAAVSDLIAQPPPPYLGESESQGVPLPYVGVLMGIGISVAIRAIGKKQSL